MNTFSCLHVALQQTFYSIYILLQNYLFLKIFQVRLLVQCYLWHILEEIPDFQAAQLNSNILI